LQQPSSGSSSRSFADDLAASNGKREVVATFDYEDEHGDLLFQVVRFEPKDFRQRRPDGRGGWVWRLGDTRRVLYRLPRVLAAVEKGEIIYVVEGEKDADALLEAGEVATCNPMGAGKWRDEYSEALRGARVIIVADRDEAGRKHAAKVAKSLEGVAADVTVVEAAEGKDAAEHLAAGREVTEFVPSPDRAGPPNGTELLDALRDYLTRFVVLPSVEAADLIALWILHTWTFDAARATPYLRVTSATPNSGKTLLLEIMAELCRRGWHAVTPSTAVLYRKIHRDQPTLLLDEIDNYSLRDRQETLAVLNAGYRAGATVDRVGDGNRLESFSCYCPKAYAGLDVRDLPPALLSRSITVRLETKLPEEKTDLWLGAAADEADDPKPLRVACGQWGEANVEAIAAVRPTLPAGLVNRSAEVWMALLAIADHVGGDWPERARQAAKVLSVGGDAADALAEPLQLLADIRLAFGPDTAIYTETLLGYLNGLDESPWGARRNGLGLDARGLAKMLRKFRTSEGAPIRPKTVGSGTSSAKGYRREDFTDAFKRHLHYPSQASRPSHVNADAERDATAATAATDTGGERLDFEAAGCTVHRGDPKPGCRYCQEAP
jgi:5S rRNA maturation endonuclease (ribonuclease M5)